FFDYTSLLSVQYLRTKFYNRVFTNTFSCPVLLSSEINLTSSEVGNLEDIMYTVVQRTLVIGTLLGILGIGAAAQQPTPSPATNNSDISSDRKDIRQDSRDIRQDRRDINKDRTDLHQDHQDVVKDEKDLTKDERDIRQDEHEIR